MAAPPPLPPRTRRPPLTPERYLHLQGAPELKPFIVSNARPTGRELGHGAYGVVMEMNLAGTLCAAKKIHDELINLASPSEVRRLTRKFVEECQLMTALRHPHIVQFLGIVFTTSSRAPLLLMEKLHTSLECLLENVPGIFLAMKRSFLHDVSRGLLFFHSHNPPIIHRDLTAANILLSSDMVAKIADLGVARMLNIPLSGTPKSFTQTPGTLVYMPPEALEPDPVYDTSLDVFSFGNLSLFTLTQEFPTLKAPTYCVGGVTYGRTELERRTDQIQQIVQSLGEQHPLTQLTVQCLKNNPYERPLMEAVILQLEELKGEMPDPFGGQTRLELLQSLVKKEEESRKWKPKPEQVTSTQSELEIRIQELQRENSILQQRNEMLTLLLPHVDVSDVGRADSRNGTSSPLLSRVRIETSPDLSALGQTPHRTKQRQVTEMSNSATLTILQTLPSSENNLVSLEARQKHLVKSLPGSYRLSNHRDSTSKGSTSLTRRDVPTWERSHRSRSWRKSSDLCHELSAEHPKISLVSSQPMHLGMTDAQAVFLDGKLYIGGGYTDKDEDRYTVLIYDPDMKEWFKLPHAPTCHFAMVAIHGDKLALVGGEQYEHNCISDILVVWDTNYDQWIVPYPPMPTARSGASAHCYQHFIIVAGGYSVDRAPLATVEILDTNLKKWYTAEPLPVKCFRPSMTQLGDMLYVLGGGRCLRIAILPLIFLATSGTKPHDLIRAELPNTPLEFSSAVCLEAGRHCWLLVVGGKDGQRTSSGMHIYNPRTESWERVGKLPAARSSCVAMATTDGGDFAVVGGYTDTGSRSNMLYIMKGSVL